MNVFLPGWCVGLEEIAKSQLDPVFPRWTPNASVAWDDLE